MARNTCGNRGDVRQSALWGSGNRGGELRSQRPLGQGRPWRIVTTAHALALAMPLAAGARHGHAARTSGPRLGERRDHVARRYLLEQRRQARSERAGQRRSSRRTPACRRTTPSKARARAGEARQAVRRSINGFARRDPRQGARSSSSGSRASTVTGTHRRRRARRARRRLDGTRRARRRRSSGRRVRRRQAVGRRRRPRRSRSSTPASTRPAPTSRGRVIGAGQLRQLGEPNSAGDGRGHGTFVAGIAAGGATGYAGAARTRKLVSIDVMDDNGVGLTSDVIAAAEWILQNKATYNIRVANFSLHVGAPSHFYARPAEPGRREALVQRRRRRRGGGQLRQADGPERRPLLPRQRPVRDHGRRGRHRRHAPGSNDDVAAPGRRTAGRTTASRSRRSPLPAATWSARSRRARRWRSRRPSKIAAPATSSSPARRSRPRSSRASRRRSSPGTRAGRRIRSRAR